MARLTHGDATMCQAPSIRTRDAFEAMVRPHLPSLRSRALRLCGGRQADAADLAQDTLERGYSHLDYFQAGTNLPAWLTRIMTNLFLNTVRRRARERASVDLVGNAQVVALQTGASLHNEHALSLDAHVVDQGLSDEVMAALTELPPDFRAVVVMSDLEDMPYKDIASALRCPPGTVMSRLSRGRRILRERLREPARAMGIHAARRPMMHAVAAHA